MNEKCNECNGAGIIKEPDEWFYCRKCAGTGSVNWIENIFGKIFSLRDMDKRFERRDKFFNGLILTKSINFSRLIKYE